jgi:hypothetical protein
LRLRPTGLGARRRRRVSHAGDAAPFDITSLDRRPDDAAALSAAVGAADAGADADAQRDPDAAAFINPDVRAVPCADGAARAGADAGADLHAVARAHACAGVVGADRRALARAVLCALVRADHGSPDSQDTDAAPDSRADDCRAVNCESDACTVAAAFGRSFGAAIVKSDPGSVAAADHTAVADAVDTATYVARAVIDADVAAYDSPVAAADVATVADPNAVRGADGRADIETFHAAADHGFADDAGGPGDGRRLVPVGWYAQRNFWWGI